VDQTKRKLRGNFFPRVRTRARATSYTQFRSYSSQIPRALRVSMYFFSRFSRSSFLFFPPFFFIAVTLVSKFQCFIDLERSCSHGYTARRDRDWWGRRPKRRRSPFPSPRRRRKNFHGILQLSLFSSSHPSIISGKSVILGTRDARDRYISPSRKFPLCEITEDAITRAHYFRPFETNARIVAIIAILIASLLTRPRRCLTFFD